MWGTASPAHLDDLKSALSRLFIEDLVRNKIFMGQKHIARFSVVMRLESIGCISWNNLFLYDRSGRS